jgi:hypothetical protein
MQVPLYFLRGFLGLLCIFFAHFLGRSVAGRSRFRIPTSKVLTWFLRAGVTGLAVTWHAGFDWLTLTVLALATLSAVLGFYVEWRPKRQEDLSKVMFPKE